MASTLPVLVQEHPDPDHSWMKFVAVLCFIEFYAEFVQGGHDLWTYGLPDLQSVFSPIVQIWTPAARVVRAVSFYLLGRSLWLGRGRMRLWLVGAILTSLAVVGLECHEWITMDRSFFTRPAGFSPGWSFTRLCLYSLHTRASWLALLLGGVVVAVIQSRWPRRRIASWVVLAIAWTAGVLVEAGFAVDYVTPELLWCFQGAHVGPAFTGLIVHVAVLGLLIAGLLRGWRWSRCVALVLAATAMTFVVSDAYIIGLLTMCAIQLLYYSTCHTASLDVEALVSWPDFFLLNQHAFRCLFVNSVAYAGPWLLIAIFAWRVPMRRLPDDGSPWPRRLCGKCFYNLHGLDSPRCPECGEPIQQVESLKDTAA